MYKEKNEYGPLTLKISGSPKDKANFLKELNSITEKKISPELYKILSEFLFEKDLKAGQSFAWDTFYSRKAGIITKTIMDKADKGKINLLDKDTVVTTEKLNSKPGVAVTLSAKLSKEAQDFFKQKNLDVAAIAEAVMHFSPSTVREVTEDVAKALKEKGNF